MAKDSSCRDPKRANRLAARFGHEGALVVAQRAREWRELMLTEAIAMYRKIGMPKHVEMAEAMLGDL